MHQDSVGGGRRRTALPQVLASQISINAITGRLAPEVSAHRSCFAFDCIHEPKGRRDIAYLSPMAANEVPRTDEQRPQGAMAGPVRGQSRPTTSPPSCRQAKAGRKRRGCHQKRWTPSRPAATPIPGRGRLIQERLDLNRNWQMGERVDRASSRRISPVAASYSKRKGISYAAGGRRGPAGRATRAGVTRRGPDGDTSMESKAAITRSSEQRTTGRRLSSATDRVTCGSSPAIGGSHHVVQCRHGMPCTMR